MEISGIAMKFLTLHFYFYGFFAVVWLNITLNKKVLAKYQ